jgi:hypothetical protein
MVSTARRRVETLDAFYTPDRVARAIVRRLRDCGVNPAGVLEPSCGKGAFVRAALAEWPTADVQIVDVRYQAIKDTVHSLGEETELHRRITGVHTGDFLGYQKRPYSLVLGNPPFSQAERHIAHARSLLATGGTLAFLLRLGFMASQRRADLHRSWRPRAVWVLRERPSFTGDGATDNSEYAVFVWGADPAKTTEIDWISWK